ncbi:hypothetical protein BpHYR1_039773 [Brachionus plicatilis]|uniref:Uncharacterized protein n=1 Tax=Brachionus plicatilis TaxID=10195 RepID=A0A3M7SLA5_BRAPC|nr:hypothetical protein BpHYR1_039773 [Brachionus plicatilis]
MSSDSMGMFIGLTELTLAKNLVYFGDSKWSVTQCFVIRYQRNTSSILDQFLSIGMLLSESLDSPLTDERIIYLGTILQAQFSLVYLNRLVMQNWLYVTYQWIVFKKTKSFLDRNFGSFESSLIFSTLELNRIRLDALQCWLWLHTVSSSLHTLAHSINRSCICSVNINHRLVANHFFQ